MPTKTVTTYDHELEAAAREGSFLAAKADLRRAREELELAELEDGNPADVAAWRAARDRHEFATEMVARAEKAVRAAERKLLSTSTELADVMAKVLERAVWDLPITVQAHRRLEIPAKLSTPKVWMVQDKPSTKYAAVGTLSGMVHLAYVASQPWAAVPSAEQIQAAGRTLSASPIYTVRYNGTVADAPAGWPSTWLEIQVSAVTDPKFVRDDDDQDGADDHTDQAGPVFAAL